MAIPRDPMPTGSEGPPMNDATWPQNDAVSTYYDTVKQPSAWERPAFADIPPLLDLLKRIFEASYYDLRDGVIRFPEDFFELTPGEGKALFRLLGHFRSADDG